jgi:RNA polymerase sigma-70 factor (ECF subfamily)
MQGTSVVSTEPNTTRRFREVVLPHLDAAFNLARWLTRSDDDAADVVQDACMRAFKSFDGFRGADGRPWLLAIVRNACWDWLRTHRGREFDVMFDEDVHSAETEAWTPSSAADPQALLVVADERRLVNEALDRLPVPYREVVILRDMEDLSYKEIAAVAAIPIGTVMSRLARARKLLMRELDGLRPGRCDGL